MVHVKQTDITLCKPLLCWYVKGDITIRVRHERDSVETQRVEKSWLLIWRTAPKSLGSTILYYTSEFHLFFKKKQIPMQGFCKHLFCFSTRVFFFPFFNIFNHLLTPPLRPRGEGVVLMCYYLCTEKGHKYYIWSFIKRFKPWNTDFNNTDPKLN